MSFPHSPQPLDPSSPMEDRSRMVFATMWLLIMLAISFPELAPQALLGILWAGAGALMIAFPPMLRVPRYWIWLAAGFVACAVAGFLPREWFHPAPWRIAVESLGLDTGRCAFVQPMLAAEVAAGFAATALTVLFLLGHRLGSRSHLHLALLFALGVGLWTVAAMITRDPKGEFGFFPNRNHTATLLAMGSFTGLGCFVQAIRLKAPGKIVLAVIPTCICLWAAFTVSESRAGIVLIATGLVAWILLTGVRHFRGHTGKAVALVLLAFIGVFLLVDSKVKSRLSDTVERIENLPTAGAKPEVSFDEGPIAPTDQDLDGRISIYRDTWSMIRNEPWTGVGPGQFAQVFPQHRLQTTASNDSRCVHPESDWLMMLAETGWPATLCLAAGVLAVLASALHHAWHGRTRILRMGCLVAAMLLVLHGVFDVPGHRVGLAWAAAWLVAISLRPPNHATPTTETSRPARWIWRGLGAILLAGGLGLLGAQWSGTPLLPSVRVLNHMVETKALYDADKAAYNQAKADGTDYQPPKDQDPLEKALVHVGQALEIAPLDPHLHYTRGVLALHYDDKTAIVTEAFAIQRALAPTKINLVMEQAMGWSILDPQQSLSLWAEAMKRAKTEQNRFPKSPNGRAGTYQLILHACGKDANLRTGALELAGNDPDLLVIWARTAPAGLLDREMPRLLTTLTEANDRLALFRVWSTRGTKGAAATFAQTHPDLGLSAP